MSGTPSRRLCDHATDENADSDTVPDVCIGGESGEPRGDTHPEDELDDVFGETETLLPKGQGAEEALHGKKRAAFEDQEGKPSNRGKMPLSGGLGRASDAAVGL